MKKKNNLLFFIQNKIGDNMYYTNIFFIYSVVGYIIEYILYLIMGYKGGILYGPWTPIYGVGSVVVLYIYNKYIAKLKTHKILKFLCIFLTGFILLSIIEYIGGVLLKILFDKTLWNYTDYEFNIGKYAALEMGFIWSISSLILIYILKKPTDIIAKKIPKYITWILIILMICDIFFTLLFN